MIDTERLTARKLTMDDAEAWLEFLQDADTLEFMPFAEPTIEDSRSWIEFQHKRYERDGHGLMALIHKETGELVGQCGLLKQTLDGRTELEVAYHIIPRFRGKGFATEAARAFKEHAFANNLSDSIVSIMHVDNVKSQRVAEKNGMQREYRTETFGIMPGVPHYVYRVKAAEDDTE